MKILFDHGVPVPLRASLAGHTVITAYELGWQALKNGDLLNAAELDGFDLLITTDSHLKNQQNLSARTIAIIVVLSASWPRIQARMTEIVAAVQASKPGRYSEVTV